VDDMAAEDVDGDGELEFAVGFNGGGGVHLVEADGREAWHRPDGNVWHVEMVDADGDGRPEIVHSNAGGEMKIRNAQGDVMRQDRPPAYFSAFSLCRWPNGKRHVLFSEEDTIWLLGLDGAAVAEVDAPECGRLGHARGVSAAGEVSARCEARKNSDRTSDGHATGRADRVVGVRGRACPTTHHQAAGER